MAAAKWTRWKRPLRLTHIDSIPENAIGVYGFWRRESGRCIYIGKAEKSLRQRVKQEWDNSHNPKLKSWIRCFGESLEICYLPVPHDKIGRVDSLETRLIRIWNPETNINKKRR